MTLVLLTLMATLTNSSWGANIDKSPQIPVVGERANTASTTGKIDNSFDEGSISLTDDLPASELTPGAPLIVVVDKDKHLTHVLQMQDQQIVDVLCIPNSTGKKSTPTPEGRMLVVEKKLDPVWTPPVSIDPKQKKVPPYKKTKKNPLGVAWLGLSRGFIGLHGTNDPARIGRNVSHGCVRHKNADIRKLYSLVPLGTPVYIVAHFAGTAVRSGDLSEVVTALNKDERTANALISSAEGRMPHIAMISHKAAQPASP
ncbi:MAG TPA: L,D-transpeptidase [Candidatus Obscuribacterales bacterium]